MGAMTELSTQTKAPAAWATPHRDRRSHTCMRGLVGLSSISRAVLPGCIAAATAATSQVSTLETDTPTPGATRSSRREVPPYRSSPATTWPPEGTRRRTAARAAMPDVKAKAASPPSRSATWASNCARVGLPDRV